MKRFRRGAMMLEYALTLGIGAVFVMAGLSIYSPGNGYTAQGRRLTSLYQRILVGISMPIP